MTRQEETEPKKWATASLRIFSEARTVSEITDVLGIAPSRSYMKGDPVSSARPPVVRSQSAWIYESGPGRSPDLATHLNFLVDFIEPRLEVLKMLLATCRVDLFCGFASESGQGGTTLDNVLLARLGRLPFDLTIDLYPPVPTED
jgi:Domain of unknown function (DUF4279)